MKALLLSKYKHLEFADLPEPKLGPGEVLVRVAACGICGSDVHGYDGSSGRRIPPIVMGHEAAGIVAALGDGVTDFAEGDRVTFDSTVYCGICAPCRRGEINLCDNRQVLGVSCADYRRAGAFAEYVAVPSRIVYRLPDSLSFAEAAILSAETDVVAQVLQLSAGAGVDVAVEAVGKTETVTAAVECVRKGGTVVLVGNISPEITLPLQKVVTRQIRLQGSCASAGEYPRAMELLETGKIQVRPLITAIAPLADGPQWFARLHAREPNLMKVILAPGALS